MRKKFLSLILALCMVLSLLPMTAFAVTADDVSGAPEISNGTWNSGAYSISLDDTTDAEAIALFEKISTDNVKLYDSAYAEVSSDAPTVEYTAKNGDTPASFSLTFSEAVTEETVYYVGITETDTESYVKVTVTAYVAVTSIALNKNATDRKSVV